MASPEVKVTKCPPGPSPTESALRDRLSREGLQAYRWSNGPGDVYSTHSHGYIKVIYVVSGEITFGLPEQERDVHLEAGDRLDLPSGVTHNAKVGPRGVVCLEAHC